MSQQSQGSTVMVQGRIVWVVGDLFKGQKRTEYGSKVLKLNAQGEPMVEYGFGLAVPKGAVQEVWNKMHQEAYSLYPTGQIPPSFAMKYKDGDTSIDDKGVSYSQREGYAGHIVLSCKTTIPIKFYKWENNMNVMINEGIKCGDYVNVQLNIKAHGAIGQGKPGLYLNPYAVQFLGYGKEIINTPSGDQVFGNVAPAIPQGASAVPLAPQPGQLIAQVQPNYAVVPQQFQPQAAPAMPPQVTQQQMPSFAPSLQQPSPNAGMPTVPGFPQIPR